MENGGLRSIVQKIVSEISFMLVEVDKMEFDEADEGLPYHHYTDYHHWLGVGVQRCDRNVNVSIDTILQIEFKKKKVRVLD